MISKTLPTLAFLTALAVAGCYEERGELLVGNYDEPTPLVQLEDSFIDSVENNACVVNQGPCGDGSDRPTIEYQGSDLQEFMTGYLRWRELGFNKEGFNWPINNASVEFGSVTELEEVCNVNSACNLAYTNSILFNNQSNPASFFYQIFHELEHVFGNSIQEYGSITGEDLNFLKFYQYSPRAASIILDFWRNSSKFYTLNGSDPMDELYLKGHLYAPIILMKNGCNIEKAIGGIDNKSRIEIVTELNQALAELEEELKTEGYPEKHLKNLQEGRSKTEVEIDYYREHSFRLWKKALESQECYDYLRKDFSDVKAREFLDYLKIKNIKFADSDFPFEEALTFVKNPDYTNPHFFGKLVSELTSKMVIPSASLEVLQKTIDLNRNFPCEGDIYECPEELRDLRVEHADAYLFLVDKYFNHKIKEAEAVDLTVEFIEKFWPHTSVYGRDYTHLDEGLPVLENYLPYMATLSGNYLISVGDDRAKDLLDIAIAMPCKKIESPINLNECHNMKAIAEALLEKYY